MLCPKCGADVGDSPRLCDKCAADDEQSSTSEGEEQEVEESESEESEAEEEVEEEQSAESESEEKVEESVTETPQDVSTAGPVDLETPPSSGKRIGIFLILVIILGVGSFLLVQGKVDLGNLSKIFSGGGDADDGEDAEEGPKFGISGMVQMGETELPFASSSVHYDAVQNRIDIGLYAQVADASAPAKTKPDMLVTLVFKHGVTTCRRDSIARYAVALNSNPGGLASKADFDLSENLEGVVHLGCLLQNGAALEAEFRQETEFDSAPLRWLVQMRSPIRTIRTKGKLHYSSSKARATVALWNRTDGVLEVGFFPEKVSPPERGTIRAKKSLLALPDKRPSVIATMDMKKDMVKFEPANLMKYGVTFYRDPEHGMDFPGPKDNVGFFYIVSTPDVNQISMLRGFLRENELIEGRLRHHAEKPIGPVTFLFSWDLDFDSAVIDVQTAVASEQKEGDGGEQLFTGTRTGPYAVIRAGRAILEAETTLALYYPKEGDLAIGFYGFPLSDAEKEKVRKNRFLHMFVNNKRPNMIVFLNFPRTAKEVRKEELFEYSVYFYRDKIGSFYFPGQFDSRSVRRSKAEMEPDEIESLSGSMKEGETVKIKMRGKHFAKRIGERFSWDVNISTQVLEVP